MFKNYTLEITKEHFGDHALNPSLSIARARPDPELYARLLERVGGPWGWDRRPKYVGENKFKSLEGANLYLLMSPRIVGYALTKGSEIENFGLFPEETGKGYGKTFLPLLLTEMFKNHDRVWLTTRSTNHAGVLGFYQDMGMRITKVEDMKDDLVPVQTPAPLLRLQA